MVNPNKVPRIMSQQGSGGVVCATWNVELGHTIWLKKGVAPSKKKRRRKRLTMVFGQMGGGRGSPSKGVSGGKKVKVFGK